MGDTMDEASLTLYSSLSYKVRILVADHRCSECAAFYRGKLRSNGHMTLQLQTDTSITLYVYAGDKLLCSQEHWLTEYGNYSLSIKATSKGEVDCLLPELQGFISHDTTEVIPNLLVGLICLLLVMYATYFLLRSKDIRDEEILTLCKGDSVPSERPSLKHSSRILSVDTFRGVAVMLMLFVNSGGGGYIYFQHSIWDGLTLADMVHPWFNWIMGMSIALTSNMDRQKDKCNRERMRQIIPRFSKLFILGMVVNTIRFAMDPTKIPIMGVLQNLAILYAVVTTLEIFLPCRQGTQKFSRIQSWPIMHDICLLWDRCVIIIVAQTVHLVILFGVNVPGCGRGYLGPGGLHRGGMFNNCTGGAAAYIDRAILGRHMMEYLSFSAIYNTEYLHDCYGPVELLSQFVQVYLGTMGGYALVWHIRNWKLVIYKWMVAGVTMITTSWLLCNYSFGFCLIPFNRQLWTLSTILLTSGIAFIGNAVIFYLVDVIKVWNGSPFFYLGCNSMACFIGQLIVKNAFPFGWVTKQTHAHLLFLSVWQTLIWTIIAILMYRYKLFLRL